MSDEHSISAEAKPQRTLRSYAGLALMALTGIAAAALTLYVLFVWWLTAALDGFSGVS